MSDDLEDFLRRAVAKRQQKAADPTPSRTAPPQQRDQRPVHNQSRVRPVIEEAQVVDEVVAEIVQTGQGSRGRNETRDARERQARQNQTRRNQNARNQAYAPEPASLKARQSARTERLAKTDPGHVYESSELVAEIIKALQSPGGIQQAILLREIIDRPEHRW